jgi:nucleoside-diphosphate-sugar epimerase
MSSFIERYSAVAKELNCEYAKKGSEEYNKIMTVMNNRYPKKEKTETQLKWCKACEALGYKFVKKDTEEYKKVLEYYKKME